MQPFESSQPHPVPAAAACPSLLHISKCLCPVSRQVSDNREGGQNAQAQHPSSASSVSSLLQHCSTCARKLSLENKGTWRRLITVHNSRPLCPPALVSSPTWFDSCPWRPGLAMAWSPVDDRHSTTPLTAPKYPMYPIMVSELLGDFPTPIDSGLPLPKTQSATKSGLFLRASKDRKTC